MTPETQGLLDKARESLAAAQTLLETMHPGFAASRAYYAMFYAAEALLLEKGMAFSKHGAVIAAFGRYFAKTGELDPKFHMYLLNAFDQRQLGDYEVREKVSEKTANELIQCAGEFIKSAETYLISKRG